MDRIGPELAALGEGVAGGGGGGVVPTGAGDVVGAVVGAEVGAVAATTLTETFMPPVQCPGKLQM
jgi:hypothetical protein